MLELAEEDIQIEAATLIEDDSDEGLEVQDDDPPHRPRRNRVPPPPVQDSFGRSACSNMTFTKVSATTSKMAVLMLTLAAFGYAMFSASKVVDDISIPTTHNEALSGPQAPLWQAAIDRELKSIESFNTWEPVDRDKVPPDSTLMRLKWVFDLKRDQLGNIIKYKARLVCQGFRQRYGIDYLDVYAPVLKYASIRILLALAAFYGWLIHQMDVSTAFLNGVIRVPLFCGPPPGHA